MSTFTFIKYNNHNNVLWQHHILSLFSLKSHYIIHIFDFVFYLQSQHGHGSVPGFISYPLIRQMLNKANF